MARLLIIRHGQASVRDGVYDPLTDRGHAQARALGRHWAKQGFVPDRVFIGPRERHHHTYEGAASELAAAGHPWPEAIELEGFDEYPADEIIRHALSKAPLDPADLQSLQGLFSGSATNGGEAKRKYARLQERFEAVMRAWVLGELKPDAESWQEFRSRVEGAIEQIRSSAKPGESAVVFTSGGPVAVSTGLPFAAADLKVLETSWLVRNSSITELFHSKDRISLGSFNGVAHILEPNLMTYR